jgi:hypothetical protein
LRSNIVQVIFEIAALNGNTRSSSGTSTRDSSQSISATRSAVKRMLPGWGRRGRRTALVRRAAPTSLGIERHPPAASHQVDPRPGLRVQEVDRRSPARTLSPAAGESVQSAEYVSDSPPVGLGLGRSSLHVAHHDKTIDEVPAIHGRDRNRHRHPLTIEVSQQLHLPRKVGVTAAIAAPAEPRDGELPVDPDAPHLVDASGSERLDPSDVPPPIECLPSHGHLIAAGPRSPGPVFRN